MPRSTINGTAIDLDGKEMILDADQDTTIAVDTDDRVDIKVAGTDTVHIDASGIGVNINNPLYPLHVTEASGGDTAAIFIDGPTDGTSALHMGDSDDIDIGSVQYDHSSNFMSFRTNAAERMRLDSSGRLNVGQTGAYAPTGSGVSIATFEEGSDSRTNLVVSNQNSGSSAGSAIVLGVHGADFIIEAQGSGKGGALTFTESSTERLKIGSDGHLYATNADTSLANLTLRKSAGDTIDYLQCRKTDNDLRIVLEGSGDVHNATGTFSAISDEKLKENIVDASSQWDDIKNIKIRNFSLKADKSSEANMIGVVAQEIEKVSPNLVKERTDRNPDTGEDLGTKTKIVKYSILHTKAVKALQEAMTRIEALESKVKALEGS